MHIIAEWVLSTTRVDRGRITAVERGKGKVALRFCKRRLKFWDLYWNIYLSVYVVVKQMLPFPRNYF